MADPVKIAAWSDWAKRALAEEALSALFFMASALMFSAGHPVIAWCLFGKAILDTLTALMSWALKRSNDRRELERERQS